MRGERLQYLMLLLLPLLLLLASAQPSRPAFSIGSILLFSNSSSFEEGASRAADCSASTVADFSARLTMPEWDTHWAPQTFEDKRQGPFLLTYPKVTEQQIPQGCDRLAWAYQRLLAAVGLTINMGLNYW